MNIESVYLRNDVDINNADHIRSESPPELLSPEIHQEISPAPPMCGLVSNKHLVYRSHVPGGGGFETGSLRNSRVRHYLHSQGCPGNRSGTSLCFGSGGLKYTLL